MAYAVTHIILTIVILDLYRDYLAKKKFSTWYVLIAGVAGLLPDADILVDGIMSLLLGIDIHTHRLITHSLLFPILLIIMGIPFSFLDTKKTTMLGWKTTYGDIALLFFVISFGWLMHVGLDCAFAGDGKLTLVPGLSIPDAICPHPFSNDFLLGLDAIILLGWLIHEQWARKIKDFI